MVGQGPQSRVSFTEAPMMSAARIPSARPTTAPLRPRAPETMIDSSLSARVPGYTGHIPGITADSLLGRSYAYITGFRKDLLSASEVSISEYKRSVAEGTNFAPKKFTRSVDASAVARPMKAPDADLQTWKSTEHYNKTLDLSADGRMPGYTGHVPHFKFQGSIGLPYAKACQYKDHLRPADGSHNVYTHEEPHHKNGVKYTGDPQCGYSGYMPFVVTQGMNVPFKRNVALSMEMRKVNPTDLRRDLDQTNAAYTPSMLEVRAPMLLSLPLAEVVVPSYPRLPIPVLLPCLPPTDVSDSLHVAAAANSNKGVSDTEVLRYAPNAKTRKPV